MLTNSTPETLPSFADVNMEASEAGDTVNKIFRSAGEMIADGEHALRAWYIDDRSDELTGLTPGCSVEELSVECTSVSLGLKLCLYATIGGCGKMSCICWSVDKMRKF